MLLSHEHAIFSPRTPVTITGSSLDSHFGAPREPCCEDPNLRAHCQPPTRPCHQDAADMAQWNGQAAPMAAVSILRRLLRHLRIIGATARLVGKNQIGRPWRMLNPHGGVTVGEITTSRCEQPMKMCLPPLMTLWLCRPLPQRHRRLSFRLPPPSLQPLPKIAALLRLPSFPPAHPRCHGCGRRRSATPTSRTCPSGADGARGFPREGREDERTPLCECRPTRMLRLVPAYAQQAPTHHDHARPSGPRATPQVRPVRSPTGNTLVHKRGAPHHRSDQHLSHQRHLLPPHRLIHRTRSEASPSGHHCANA